MIETIVAQFFAHAPQGTGRIYNERALQLELAMTFRSLGWGVEFERPFLAGRPVGSTRKPKTNLDLLLRSKGQQVALELKVPLNGRHPETMYDFCADLEFVEALVRHGHATAGFCLMATNDRAFWEDSGRGSDIHNAFRLSDSLVSGTISKPTGAIRDCVHIEGKYCLAKGWRAVADPSLMKGSRYLLVQVAQ